MPEATDDLHRTLSGYVTLIVRRRWWFILPFCGVLLATAALSLILPNVYRSETTILVEGQKVPEHYVISNVASELRDRLHTMTQQILSRTRLLQIIEDLGLYTEERKTQVPEELVELMRSNIEIELMQPKDRREHLNAFKVSFLAEDPRIAQQVATRLTSLFIEENLKTREQQSLGTTNFLQTQLEGARQQLQETEKRLGEFKMKYLGELPDQQTANLQVYSGMQTQLQNTMVGLNHAREQRVYLQSMLAQHQSLAETSGTVIGGPSAAEQELERLRKERTALRARYTERHPDVVRLEREIGEREASLKAEAPAPATSAKPAQPPTSLAAAQLKSQLDANEVEIQNLAGQESMLRGKLGMYERRLNLTPIREQELADLVRDYNISKQNYEELLKKKMESELATNLEKRQQGEQFRILDPPSLPERAAKPDRKRIATIGLVLAFALGAGMVFFAEIRDRSMHTEYDLRQVAPPPLIVGVPDLLTPAERHQVRIRRLKEIAAAILLGSLSLAGEIFTFLKG